MTSITPVRASALKWGVCAHLDAIKHPTPDVVAAVQRMGCTIVRSNHRPKPGGRGTVHALALRAAGIRLHQPLPTPDDWRDPGAIPAAARRYFDAAKAAGITHDSVEFCNEMDALPGYAAVIKREIAATAAVCAEYGVPMLGPSFRAFNLGEAAPAVATDDKGRPLATHYPAGYALHSYNSSQAPTGPILTGRLGLVRTHLAPAPTPIALTETGWWSDTPEGQAACLAPQVVLALVGDAVEWVTFYELVDEPGREGKEASFGLLKEDLTRKPVADALADLAELLACHDDTDEDALVPADVTVAGDDATRCRLVQRGDGSRVLFLWRAVDGAALTEERTVTVTIDGTTGGAVVSGMPAALEVAAAPEDPDPEDPDPKPVRKRIINLTGVRVSVRAGDKTRVPPAGDVVATVATRTGRATRFAGLDVTPKRPTIKGLPDPVAGTMYLVTDAVAAAAVSAGRDDVLTHGKGGLARPLPAKTAP